MNLFALRFTSIYCLCLALIMSAISQPALAWPNSFDDGTGPYNKRRVPVMQRGVYQPTQNAPVAKPMRTEGDGRPCCRDNSVPRWYVGFTGYVVFLRDQDIELSPTTFLNKPKTVYTTNRGYGWSANIGYRITPDIRGELEFARRENDTDKAFVTNPAPAGTNSVTKSTAYMANVYYDFLNSSNFTPYLGGGIGMAKVDAPISYTAGAVSTMLKEWTVAYQFMGGVSYRVDLDLNPIEFNLGYRYFTGQDLERRIRNSNARATYFNDSHNVELGGKFFF